MDQVLWCCFLVLVQSRTWIQMTWRVLLANRIQPVIDMADIHTSYPVIERYQLKLSRLSYLCKYPLINKLVFSQVYGVRWVSCMVARLKSDGRSGEQQPPWLFLFFLLELLGCSGAFRWWLFSTTSDQPLHSPVSHLFCTFSLSFCVFFSESAFEMSYTCLHDVPTGLWPTLKAHHWYSFNPAALEHLWYRRGKANPN